MVRVFLFLMLSGCATSGGGIAVRTLDPEQAGVLRCLGLEAHEIIKLSQAAVQDLQENFLTKHPSLMREGKPLRVVVDSTYWRNDSQQTININMISDQISVKLQQAARGKLAFLTRENLSAVQEERQLKREGSVDKGALGLVDKIAGADYRMVGSITDHSTKGSSSTSTRGVSMRGTSIVLSLVDLETGAKVWSWQFNLLKEGEDENFC